MAGIGFELNKILARRGYTATVQAYAYAGLVGSGPWLFAVISLALLGSALRGVESNHEVRLFFVSVSFIYGLTLILTGPIQMVLTRFAADKMFAGDEKGVFPIYVVSLGWMSLVSAAAGWLVFGFLVPGPALFRLAAVLLTVLVSATWISGIFLTALKNYHAVLVAFVAGCGGGFLFAWGMSLKWGVSGAMLGLCLGQALLFLMLGIAIYRELGTPEMGVPGFAGYFVKYWDLAVCGLLYNLGIWSDKLLYWWMDPGAEPVAGILKAAPVYDRVVYFSFLTIVPGMAVFLLKLETDFAEHNQSFFDHVLRRGTLNQILVCKAAMIEALRNGFELLIRVQGLFTCLMVLCAEPILKQLGLGAVQAGVFQISLIGVFLLVLFLALLTILHYLDKRRDAMWCTILFAGSNTAITAISILAGERWYGFGFLVASGLAVVMAAAMVNSHLKKLDFDTFTSQPIYN